MQLIKIFNDNKFFGIGLKNFRMESGNTKYEIKTYYGTDARQTTHPHQIHFEILSEIGLIGQIKFITVLFNNSEWNKIYKNSKIYFNCPHCYLLQLQ